MLVLLYLDALREIGLRLTYVNVRVAAVLEDAKMPSQPQVYTGRLHVFRCKRLDAQSSGCDQFRNCAVAEN